ncbi:unnamed protein product [Cylicocyclus nassatus]|uniref:Uncharacterized protein n=1 Tax=Cylicocyclus nassatus TaxID=53992 RepID=A0AA36H4K8_CYLNA|nr:unnamed protein product [Cylicocyclus nassatus]
MMSTSTSALSGHAASVFGMDNTVATLRGDVSLFETNIRFIGWLLSLYALTNDKAEASGKMLLPYFDMCLINVTEIRLEKRNLLTSWISRTYSFISILGLINGVYDFANIRGRSGRWSALPVFLVDYLLSCLQ